MDQGTLQTVLTAIQNMRDENQTSQSENREQINDLRSEISSWRIDLSQRLAKAELSIKTNLDGNGQPAVIAVLRKDVSLLQNEKSRHKGAKATLILVGGLIGTVVGWVVIAGPDWATWFHHSK